MIQHKRGRVDLALHASAGSQSGVCDSVWLRGVLDYDSAQAR